MRELIRSTSTIFIVSIFLLPLIVGGQVRESLNYKIERDSLNTSGGFGSSGSYQLQNTIGETGTGYSNSSSYANLAGFQQSNEESYISISTPSDLIMSSLNGLIGGYSTSSVSWTVTTNNNAGYSLGIKSSTSPSLKSSLDYFADYTITTSDPDFDFATDYDTAEFGFSPSGADIIGRFKDDGTSCNTGTNDGLYKCWDGLTTSTAVIAQTNSSNDPTGSLTTINFKAETGSERILTAGDYSATITMTAIAL